MAKSKISMLLDSGYAAPPKPPWPPLSCANASTYSLSSPRTSSSSSARASAACGGHASSAPAPVCAACKHQRHKCKAGCILAPYFPPDQPRRFRNALRLFGVKNILRILKEAGPEKRDDCMGTIIYESDARADRPVHGCRGIIGELNDRLSLEATELATVRQLLAFCRRTRRLQPPRPSDTALSIARTPHMTTLHDDVHARRKKIGDVKKQMIHYDVDVRKKKMTRQ